MTFDRANRSDLLRLISAAAIITVILAVVPASAQTLKFPGSVCTGASFAVDWTGPGGGDVITVAVPQLPPNEYVAAAPTAAGNPALLVAPENPGTYDVRYVRSQPLAILLKKGLQVERCEPPPEVGGAMPPVAVEARGTQFDFGDKINRNYQGPYGQAGYTIDDFCEVSDEIGAALRMMVYEAESALAQSGAPVSLDMIELVPGVPSREEIERDLAAARDEICDDRPPKTVVQPFVVTYAWCRMAMWTPAAVMDIHLPEGTGNGAMSMADHASQEIVQMALRRNIQALETSIGEGWGEGISMTATGASGTRIGYPVSQYDFSYSGSPGGGALEMVGSMVKMESEGTVWASQEVPGIDVVRTFYGRLSAEVDTGSGGMSFFGGLFENLVGMLQKGLPLEIEQTVRSKVAGATMVSGKSRHVLTSIRLVDLDPQWCSESLMPDGYKVTDVDEQLAEAMGSAGTSPDEMASAMAEYNQAMEQLTPEQRAMMESMGMGQMMQQAAGAGAMPGSAPSATAAASSSMPKSAELTTNNLTESVQKHLEALGYETGNTAGDASLETTIAISQFQAEKGLEVTGEVTPQLLGVLSAEVDARR